MAELYLVAHKVRGEAAFDITERVHCPVTTPEASPCAHCDCDIGYWYITTTGHRAHPYWEHPLYDILQDLRFDGDVPEMPEDAVDLFPANPSAKILSSGKSLLSALGLLPKVVRRL